MDGTYTLNPEAGFDVIRYWIGYPTEKPLDDLACKRVEEIVTDRITPIHGFDVYAVEARPEYVLAVVEGTGVQTPPQEVTDRLGSLIRDYNTRYVPRPTNDVTELDIRRRHVGTIGRTGAEEDLEDAREFLRERGASSEDVSADAGDAVATAEAEAGGGDE